jgi:hypothetical protein
MKITFDIRSLLCGALLGAAVILLTGATGQQQDKGWEYTTHFYARGNQAPIPELNKLGADGWELAAALAGSEGLTHGFVFKRPAPRRVRE